MTEDGNRSSPDTYWDGSAEISDEELRDAETQPEEEHWLPPERQCRATRPRNGKPCTLPAGWGVEGKSEGRCKFHGGAGGSGGARDGAGAPETNDNAMTHGLYTAEDNYYQNLSNDEKEWVYDFSHDLLDRYRDAHGKEPDIADIKALKNIAIDFHRVAHANGWFSDHGLVTVDYENTEDSEDIQRKTTTVPVWAREIRQYNESIYRRMDTHGLLEDPEDGGVDPEDLSTEYYEIIVPSESEEESEDSEGSSASDSED